LLKGDNEAYEKLKSPAMALGSAFSESEFFKGIFKKTDLRILNP